MPKLAKRGPANSSGRTGARAGRGRGGAGGIAAPTPERNCHNLISEPVPESCRLIPSLLEVRRA